MPEIIEYSLRKAKQAIRRRRYLSSPDSSHEILSEIIKKDPNFLVNLLNVQKKAGLWDPERS